MPSPSVSLAQSIKLTKIPPHLLFRYIRPKGIDINLKFCSNTFNFTLERTRVSRDYIRTSFAWTGYTDGFHVICRFRSPY